MIQDIGDDVIYGGSYGEGDQYLIGGYGNDKIITGHDHSADATYVIAFGDNRFLPATSENSADFDNQRGSPNDGDDIIDIGDNPLITRYAVAYG